MTEVTNNVADETICNNFLKNSEVKVVNQESNIDDYYDESKQR